MPAPSAIDPPDPRTAADPAEYIERLKALRFWAGEPSLRRLRQLAGTTLDARGNRIDALPTSTISQVLRRGRLARMEFVRAYVTACLAAQGFGAEATAEQLARWHDAWLAVQSDDPPPLRSASTPPPEAPTADLKPRQLPADLSTFTGREAELAELVALATGADGAAAPATVLISAIDGMAGVGKTAFAVHAAHRLAGHYPDGQLFIDLHGYAALDLSYQQLTGDEQRAYRLLGGHPGPEADRYAAAALINTTVPHTQRLLDRLLEVYLLQEPAPGRYRFHDLVRAHAANIRRDHPDPRLTAGLDRLLDYYRHTVALAVDAAYPYERDHRPRVPPARTPVPDVSDPARARSWLATELSNLLAAAKLRRRARPTGTPAALLGAAAPAPAHLRPLPRCRRPPPAGAGHRPRHRPASGRDRGADRPRPQSPATGPVRPGRRPFRAGAADRW